MPIFAAPLHSAGVCVSLFGLSELLSWFGFSDAFCQEIDGQWYPLRGQVSVGGTVSLGWSIAGLWARLEGTMQYINSYDNPICALSQYNSWWNCQNYCSWSAGDGQVTASGGEQGLHATAV
jgi:hypothetical protein